MNLNNQPSPTSGDLRLHSGLAYKTPLEVANEYQQNLALSA